MGASLTTAFSWLRDRYGSAPVSAQFFLKKMGALKEEENTKTKQPTTPQSPICDLLVKLRA